MFASARQLADPARDSPGCAPTCRCTWRWGTQDPVNGQLALVHGLVERLQRRRADRRHADGSTQGARHEVFNETNRTEVVADLLAWLDRVVPPRG